jgi:hypothetical protein
MHDSWSVALRLAVSYIAGGGLRRPLSSGRRAGGPHRSDHPAFAASYFAPRPVRESYCFPGGGVNPRDCAALENSSDAGCGELTFSNQSTNSCKWNTQHGRSFMEIYEKFLGFVGADVAAGVSDRTGVECRFGTLRRASFI